MKKNVQLIGKILELLGEGFALKFERDKGRRRQIYQRCDEIWYSLDRKQLYRALDTLQLNGVIKIIKDNDGIENIRLTNKKTAFELQYRFQNIKPKKLRRWDRKWRIVMFDIPETKRKMRDSLRRKLKEMGFIEFQKSTFIYPFPCEEEVNFVMNILNISEHVYYIKAPISPDHTLRKHFKLVK